MKATKENISDVLRTNMEGVRIVQEAPAGNGFVLEFMFLRRSALTDLMNNFHVYLKEGKIVVITPGMESTKDRL